MVRKISMKGLNIHRMVNAIYKNSCREDQPMDKKAIKQLIVDLVSSGFKVKVTGTPMFRINRFHITDSSANEHTRSLMWNPTDYQVFNYMILEDGIFPNFGLDKEANVIYLYQWYEVEGNRSVLRAALGSEEER